MHGEVVAQSRRGRHWIVFVLLGEPHKPVVGLVVDHRALFNPADLVLFRLDLEKAPAMLQHFQRLPVDHLAHAVRNRRYAVVQIGLADRNVHHLMVFVPESPASGQEERQHSAAKAAQAGLRSAEESEQKSWETSEHSSWRCLENSTFFTAMPRWPPLPRDRFRSWT